MNIKTILVFALTVIVLFACSPTQNFTNSLGMSFVYIEPGTFMMGDDSGMDNEKPAHRVTISNGFYMQTTEVTVCQFRKFIEETSYKTTAEQEDGTYVFADGGYQKKKDANWRNPYFKQTENHPVVCVSRNDIDNFILWLTKKEGKEYRI